MGRGSHRFAMGLRCEGASRNVGAARGVVPRARGEGLAAVLPFCQCLDQARLRSEAARGLAKALYLSPGVWSLIVARDCAHLLRCIVIADLARPRLEWLSPLWAGGAWRTLQMLATEYGSALSAARGPGGTGAGEMGAGGAALASALADAWMAGFAVEAARRAWATDWPEDGAARLFAELRLLSARLAFRARGLPEGLPTL